jgi:hypothetical protein
LRIIDIYVRAITPKWVMGFTSKLQVRKILTCCGCGGHLGRCSEMPDTILEEDHLYKHNDELFNIYYRIFYEL